MFAGAVPFLNNFGLQGAGSFSRAIETPALGEPGLWVTEHTKGETMNGFQHLDPPVSGLENFDLGIAYCDDPAPPPPGSSVEPALFVNISVFQISPECNLGIIYYCRYRTFLRDGLRRDGTVSSATDRVSTLNTILQRLPMDVALFAEGRLSSSQAAPISV